MKFYSYSDFCYEIIGPSRKHIAHGSAEFVRVSSSKHLTDFLEELSLCPAAWKKGEYFFEAFILPTKYFSAIYNNIHWWDFKANFGLQLQ